MAIRKPSGIVKIEASLKDAKSKGYNVTKVYGTFKSFVKAKKLTDKPFAEQVKLFNDYLAKYNLAVFSNKKGMFYCKLADYKPYNETVSLDW